MNRQFVFTLCLALLLTVSMLPEANAQQQPDVYIEELVERSMPGQPLMSGVIKSWVSGNKLRREAPGGAQISIFRGDLKKVFLLNTITKQYSEVPIEVIRKDQEKNLNFYAPVKDGKMELPKELYRKTGNKKKIGKWEATEVEVLIAQSGPEVEVDSKIWISKDTGYDQAFVRRLFYITMGGEVSKELKELFDKMTALDGYPVRKVTTTTVNKQTFTDTETLVKIEKKNKIDPKMFEVPKDYQLIKQTMPGMVPQN